MDQASNSTTRRDFVRTTGGALAASVVAGPSLAAQAAERKRYAIVGTGIRGTTMWGRQVAEGYSDVVDFVGLCDTNPKRLEASKGMMGVSCPTFTDFDRMCDQARPELLMVTTVDTHHAEYIVRALDRGIDVITEKPMVIDEAQCQQVLDAEKRNSRQIVVTFKKAEGGHGGGDTRLRDLVFRGVSVPDHLQLPGSRAGALSCLTGIAARLSCDEGRRVSIDELVRL